MWGLAACGTFLNPAEARAFCQLGSGSVVVTLVGFPPPSPENLRVDRLDVHLHPDDGGGFGNIFDVPWNTSEICLGPGRWQFQASDAEGEEVLVGPDTSTGWTDYE